MLLQSESDTWKALSIGRRCIINEPRLDLQCCGCAREGVILARTRCEIGLIDAQSTKYAENALMLDTRIGNVLH